MNSINNMYFEISNNRSFIKQKEKNDTKEKAELLSLVTMLKKIEGTLSHVETFSEVQDTSSLKSSAGTSSPSSNNNWPSSENISSALSALAAMIHQLSQDKAKAASSNAGSVANNLLAIYNLKLSQLEKASQLLKQLQDLENSKLEKIKKLLDFIQSWMGSDEDKMEFHKNGWSILKKYIYDTFGISIKFNQRGGSAVSQFTAFLNNQINNASNKAITYMRSTNDPSLMILANYMAHNQKVSPETISRLENILEQSLKILSEISDIGAGKGPSEQLLLLMLNLMTSSLGNLQTSIAETSSDRTTSDETMSKAFNEQAQNAYKKVQEQIAKIEEEKSQEKTLGIFADIVGAVITVCTLGTGALAVAAIMATMTVLQATGTLSKLSSSIAKCLVKDGMSQEDAKWLADVIVVAITIAVTLGAGGAASVYRGASLATSAAVADTAAEGAASGTVDSLLEEEEAVTENIAAEASTPEKTNILKSILNAFKKIPMPVNLSIATGMQSVMSTNLSADATLAAMKHENKSENQIEQAQMIASIVTAVVGLLVTTMSISGIGAAEKTAAQSAEAVENRISSGILAKIKNSMKTFENFMKTQNWITTLSKFNNYVLGAAQVGSKTAMGINQANMANSQIDLGKTEALQQLMEYYQKMTTQDMDKTTKSLNSLLKSHERTLSGTLSEVLAFQATYAHIMAQSA